MRRSLYKQSFLLVCSLAACALTAQLQAEWYGQRSQPDYNPGFGDFPPQLQAEWYGQRSQPNYNPGFGDFPPPWLEQQLQNRVEDKVYEVKDEPSGIANGDSQVRGRTPSDRQSSQNRREGSSSYSTPNNWRSNAYRPPSNENLLPGYYGQNRNISPFGGSSSGFNKPWEHRGSSFQTPLNNKSSGLNPWSQRGSRRGGRDPFGNRGPDEWLSPDKKSLSRNWDDVLNAPSRMGEMPGGWEAPSVSVPNPVDVGDEFDNAARDLPDQMDNFKWDDYR